MDTGTDECGLDLDHHGPCKMAAGRREPDFALCDLPARHRCLLEAGKRHIRFHPSGLPPSGIGFEAWREAILDGQLPSDLDEDAAPVERPHHREPERLVDDGEGQGPALGS